MKIALDFDATYTLDPEFWDGFISSAFDQGHYVLLATYRHPHLDAHPLLDKLKEKITCYFTDGKAKKPYLEERGIVVDVWIDDRPLTVLEDSAWGVDSPELHAWRDQNRKNLELV
jgi:hypothetical protein